MLNRLGHPGAPKSKVLKKKKKRHLGDEVLREVDTKRGKKEMLHKCGQDSSRVKEDDFGRDGIRVYKIDPYWFLKDTKLLMTGN